MCDLFRDSILQRELLIYHLIERFHCQLLKLICVSEIVPWMQVFDDWLEQISKDLIGIFICGHYPYWKIMLLYSTLDYHLDVTSLRCVLLLKLAP